MLRSSEIENITSHFGCFLYGDQEYPQRSWLITPCADAELTKDQRQFNMEMNKGLVAVEWNFGSVVRYWKFFEFPSNMKVFKPPVA
ncbi:hypothetical protein PHMEG_00010342 [Phytophthora megakarya]|uniref:DDE Tnp4 domain-containing protein n=1 Tax=Phytophthora megakarya TaxID=4795 RepID=A0A225WDY1_9STRA|nr:hypothetical protein PHMEG_00010342 [Phytophthora megakarya]